MGMMRLADAARALGATLRGEDRPFDAVGTDTRTLAAHALFVALRGPRFDGHDFLEEAAARRAAGALVERAAVAARACPAQLPLLLVSDTRRALGDLAACWRRRFQLPLVAVTGSNGKTTVKEMLAAILREALRAGGAAPERAVLATRGNLNNDIGVPLTLLELSGTHRYAVVEMGMNRAGELSRLARLAAPVVALVNNVGPAHLGFFDSLEAIARAKAEVFEALAPEGTAVINADDAYAPLLRAAAAPRRCLEFGLAAEAAVSARYRLRPLESEIVLRTPLGEATTVLAAPGLHNVRNALAAAAAALALGVAPGTIALGLARFEGVRGRLERKAAARGAVVLDDTYNANPDSARAALEVLALAPGEKLAVLGDMGELGERAAALHAAIGEAARALGIDRLYTLGELAAHAARAFGAGARHFERPEELVRELREHLAPGVSVLVKGSRFMRMERIVEPLLQVAETGAEQGRA